MSEFKLIARYLPGLKRAFDGEYVSASSLEAALEKGIQLHGYAESSATDHWSMTKVKGPGDTHCGLLIGIQEIQPESEIDEARQIIKDLLDTRDISPVAWSKIPSTEQRARAFLARSRK